MLLVLLAHSFATIANMQWFSEEPSPLNGMVGGNHWDQWFSNGFGVRQPLETMVFDGCAPLVRRCNGYVPSLKSIGKDEDEVVRHLRQRLGVLIARDNAMMMSSRHPTFAPADVDGDQD